MLHLTLRPQPSHNLMLHNPRNMLCPILASLSSSFTQVAAFTGANPATDPKAPDIIVQPNPGVVYSHSGTKRAEHGECRMLHRRRRRRRLPDCTDLDECQSL